MQQVTLQSKLVEARQQVRDIAGRINVVEERIDIVQRQLDHANVWRQLDETAIAAVRTRDQDQTVDRLWQELSRLGQKEDRLRQEKLIAAQVELTLYGALLQVPPGGLTGKQALTGFKGCVGCFSKHRLNHSLSWLQIQGRTSKQERKHTNV